MDTGKQNQGPKLSKRNKRKCCNAKKYCKTRILHRVVSSTWDNSWWRYHMEAFSVLLALCVGNSPVTGEFPSQRPVMRSFEVSLIYAWTNDCVKNPGAGGLIRQRAHDDVTVMLITWHQLHLLTRNNLWWKWQEIIHISPEPIKHPSDLTRWSVLYSVETLKMPIFYGCPKIPK